MPEKLLSIDGGIPKSLLSKVTATESDVVSGKTFIGSDGTLKTGSVSDRGVAQYGGGFGGGTESSTNKKYISINKIPEGIYRANGYSWAPEIRAYYADLASYIGLTASKIVSGNTILGIAGTNKGYTAGYNDGVNDSKYSIQTEWATMNQNDSDLVGRQFRVQVHTLGNKAPDVWILYNNNRRFALSNAEVIKN